MAKKGVRGVSLSVVFSKMLRVLGDVSLVLSAIFIFMGFGSDGWDILSSASFWTVINSTWLFALLLFYFSERVKN